MTEEDLSLQALLEIRAQLIHKIKNELTSDEKKFLLSFKSKSPDWDLLGLKDIEKLPAVKWKLLNLGKMNKKEHEKAYKKLEEYLS